MYRAGSGQNKLHHYQIKSYAQSKEYSNINFRDVDGQGLLVQM
jgi:hypothetical protein